jgi:hypothetical protein
MWSLEVLADPNRKFSRILEVLADPNLGQSSAFGFLKPPIPFDQPRLIATLQRYDYFPNTQISSVGHT